MPGNAALDHATGDFEMDLHNPLGRSISSPRDALDLHNPMDNPTHGMNPLISSQNDNSMVVNTLKEIGPSTLDYFSQDAGTASNVDQSMVPETQQP